MINDKDIPSDNVIRTQHGKFFMAKFKRAEIGSICLVQNGKYKRSFKRFTKRGIA